MQNPIPILTILILSCLFSVVMALSKALPYHFYPFSLFSSLLSKHESPQHKKKTIGSIYIRACSELLAIEGKTFLIILNQSFSVSVDSAKCEPYQTQKQFSSNLQESSLVIRHLCLRDSRIIFYGSYVMSSRILGYIVYF